MPYLRYSEERQGFEWGRSGPGVYFSAEELAHVKKRGGIVGIVDMLPDKTLVKNQAALNEEMRPGLVVEIKKEARRRIEEIAPEFKQRNMLARRIELQEKAMAGAKLTREEIGEIEAARLAFSKIKALRDASDRIEAEAMKADDLASFNVCDPNRWSS